jgi:large subunit ribosomal protein L32
MAVPKKKTSPSRRGLRRAGHTHKLMKHFTISCPNCSAPILPHHVCPACGVYKKMEVIKIQQAEEGEE